MKPYVSDSDFDLWVGDAADVLPTFETASIDAVVTSPPYLDSRPEYRSPTIDSFYEIFRELRRVVTGPALVNVGRIFRDGKELRWWVALAERAEAAGWDHLDTVVWIKPNANPIHGEVLANRHEYVLILGRAGEPLNTDAVRVAYAEASIGRLNRGWTKHVSVKGSGRVTPRVSPPNPLGARAPSYIVCDTGKEKGNPHPCPMPVDLAFDLVTLACREGGTILDPFAGSGNTVKAARLTGRRAVAIELNPSYAALCASRNAQQSLLAG